MILLPIAVCQPYTATLDSAGNITITGSNVDSGSSDNSGFTLPREPNIFSCSDVGGPITVTLTVSDQAGNTATCTTEVTVIDNTPPSIDCPGDMTDNPEAERPFILFLTSWLWALPQQTTVRLLA